MRIVAWNIRAGGGQRVEAIGRQLERWAPDVVALSEFRATAPSLALAATLAEAGLPHQLTTADPARPQVNALLVAARWRVRRVRLRAAPVEQGRWAPCRRRGAGAAGHRRDARPESRRRTQVSVPGRGAHVRPALASRTGPPRRGHELRPARARRGGGGVQRARRRLDRRPGGLPAAGRLPPHSPRGT